MNLTAFFLFHVPRLATVGLFTYLTWPLYGRDAPLFHWHPFLMTLCIALCLPGGLSSLQPCLNVFQSLGVKMGHSAKVRLHWVLMVLATVLGVCGLAVIYYNKILNDKPHFTSWHGLIGAITVCFFVTQTIGGIFVLYPAYAFGVLSKSSLRKYHIFCGCLLAIMGYMSFLLGLFSNWFVSKVSSTLWLISGLPLSYWIMSVIVYNVKRLG